MSIWYRTGGTLNFAWHVVSDPGEGTAAIVERLYTAGYCTIEADRQPTEFAPEGYRRGAYAWR